MKKGFTRQDFAEKLKKAVYEISINVIEQEAIISNLSKRGYELGYISSVLEGNVVFDSLDLMDLGVFALEIHKITGDNLINPKRYFEDIELDRITRHKTELEQDVLKYPVVFEDVRRVAHNIWSVIVPAEFIAKLGRSNMLNYEFKTQREPKTIETKDGIILTPSINPKSVIEIADEILKKTFKPNTLTFNIPFKDSDNFKYDENSKKWVLIDGKMDILDGYHRYLSIVAATRIQFTGYNFELRLTNFDEDEANDFIVQEDKRNPISKEYIKSIDNSSLITQIITKLNQSNKSELRGKITTDKTSIVRGFSLVRFDTMYKSIDKLWSPRTINEANTISDYLKDFYNILVDLYPDEFKFKIAESRRNSQINNEKMFIIYNIIAKRLKGNNSELKLIIDNINFEDEQIKEFMGVSHSMGMNKFNRYFKMANEIAEVNLNVKQTLQ